MNEMFYIASIRRDDGERLVFDGHEMLLSDQHSMLARPEIDTSEVMYTDANGGDMTDQRLLPHVQTITGLVYPRQTPYWDLYFRLTAFFKIRKRYTVIYKRADGQLFALRDGWMTDNLQISPVARETSTPFTVGIKFSTMRLYEYRESQSGEELYANTATLPLITASSGGLKWDSVGQVWDSVGQVWDAGHGGLREVFVNSTSDIYPVWRIGGPAVNPSIQNNTTDTTASYLGAISSGQTLVVDFATGEARLDGAVVSRNLTGSVKFKPGINIAGFNADSAADAISTIEWNNILGAAE